jgi:hypothetical protein
MLQLELDDREHRERIRSLAQRRGQTMTSLILALLADEAARQSPSMR